MNPDDTTISALDGGLRSLLAKNETKCLHSVWKKVGEPPRGDLTSWRPRPISVDKWLSRTSGKYTGCSKLLPSDPVSHNMSKEGLEGFQRMTTPAIHSTPNLIFK